MKSKLFHLFAPLCLVCSGALSAQSVSINLGGPDYAETIKNQFIFTKGDLSVTATGWSVSRNQDAPFIQSQIAQWSPGIGVKNSSEKITDVPYVPYYVDNETHYDFVLFVFNKTVDVDRISINPSGHHFDRDVSYQLLNLSADESLSGRTLAQIGSLSHSDAAAGTSSRWIDVSSPSHGVNALLIGARVGGDSTFDRFKIGTIESTALAVVPEPSTLLLAGFSTAFLWRRRRI